MSVPATTPSGATRTPVHVLTGFLGSGKTTLLCNLLADPEFSDTAVIINEFGEAGLDHLLVREVTEDVMLLSSGCLCCTVRDDLVTTLADLDRMQRAGQISRFSRVVVETTGLADPAPILQAILTDPLLTGSFGLGSVVTTIDAINGVHTLAAQSEARQQLRMADRVVLTKADLASEAEKTAAADCWRSLNRHAPLSIASNGRVDACEVFAPNPPSWKRFEVLQEVAPHRTTLFKASSHHDETINTFTVRLSRAVDWHAFEEWLQLLLASRGYSILRVKGLLAVTGDSRPVVVQGVQHVMYPPEKLPQWPDPAQPQGWLVFIARDLTQQAIESSLQSL